MMKRKLLYAVLALSSILVLKAQTPLRMEYFLDSDPGYGQAYLIHGLKLAENTLTFDLSSSSCGAHVLYVRSQDSEGHWGTTMSRPLYVEHRHGQEPRRMEYFLDFDPGYGNARQVESLKEGSNELTFDISDARAGAHVLYVRSQDDVGQWSTTMSRPLYIEQLQDIVRVECFVDSDPGMGLATALPLPDVDYKAHLDFDVAINTDTMSLGFHELFIRACDALGQWTDVMSRQFEVVEKSTEPVFEKGDLARMEYFFDIDPGYGQGFPLLRASTGENSYEVSLDAVESGAHLFCLRAQDDEGRWSTVSSRPIYVTDASMIETESASLARIEYFFDRDPGYGKGTPLPKASTGENSYEVSFDAVEPGAHLFCLRAQDEQGRWSAVLSRPLYVVNPLGVAALEYFFDTDPGEGKATPVPTPDNLDEAFAFVAATDGLPIGEHRLCVRAKGLDGLWTLVSSSVFTVSEGGLKGDVNLDGTVDVADIATIISVMAGSVGSGFATSTDVNGDGVVDVADIATVISIMAANARMLEEVGK